MTIHFTYEKSKVIQALRYHFITRPEIRLMIILVNVFALLSATLFYFKIVTPLAFFIGSILWFMLMISVWFLLPEIIYRRTSTFKDHFDMSFEEDGFSLGNERGSRNWPWKALSTFLKARIFFICILIAVLFFLFRKEDSDQVTKYLK